MRSSASPFQGQYRVTTGCRSNDTCYKRWSTLHTAAILLTLLPNDEMLTLADSCKPLDAAEKLIDTVVPKSEQSLAVNLASARSLELGFPFP